MKQEPWLAVLAMVETYLNGNVSVFKKWIKHTTKRNIILAVDILNNYGENGLLIVSKFLEER